MDFTNRGVVNSTLRKAAKRLEMVHIATNVTCITKAKVPIIKFVDRVTNINVDISFENLSGVQAQATFQQWKHDYPDMIYMVALLKQFLVMRGMNEVHTGGIGGFGCNHHLRQSLVHLDARVLAQPEMYVGGLAAEKFGEDGRASDPDLAKLLSRFAATFADWVEKMA